MNISLLKQICAVPTKTHEEDRMVHFLTSLINSDESRFGRCVVDAHRNIFVVKGDADYYPTVAAHIDSVQPIREVQVREHFDVLTAEFAGKQVGFGADDKTGVYVCLELLQRFDKIAVAFFAGEEQGCQGAFAADLNRFDQMAYMLEFDCPSRGLMSYTSAGQRLFENNGDFIKSALPVLNKYGTEWQRHPYTDVMAVAQRTKLSCLNLSSGYYNWHACDEYIRLSDVEVAVEMAAELIPELGWRVLDRKRADATSTPLVEIKPLRVVDKLLG